MDVKLLLQHGYSIIGKKIYINIDEIVLKNPIMFVDKEKFDFAQREKRQDEVELHINKRNVIWYYEVKSKAE